MSFPLYFKNLSPTLEAMEIFLYVEPDSNVFDPDKEQGGDLWFITNAGKLANAVGL